MRVLVISQHFWPEEFRINDVVHDLYLKGHCVSVLTGQPNYPGGRIFSGYSCLSFGRSTHPSGYEIVRVPIFPRRAGQSVFLALNYLSFVLSASILGPWLLRRCEFDVVLVYALSPVLQSIPAIILARLKSSPMMIWVQDLWPESLLGTGRVTNRGVIYLVSRLTGWIYRQCSQILV